MHLASQALLVLACLVALAPGAQAQALTPQARRDDLAQFRAEFLARDRAYTPAARRQAEQALAELEALIDTLDATAFALALARTAALADNGHSIAWPGPRAARGPRVPVRLLPFGEDFVVLRARSGHADLLGARLLAIDAAPMARLREAARSLAGGVPAWRDLQAPHFLESPEQLRALGLAEAADAATYHFQLADGRRVERRLVAEPPAPKRPQAESLRLLLPEVTPPEFEGQDTDWRGLLPLAQAPWSLQEAAQPFRWRALPALKALQLDLRRTRDAPGARLADFFETVRAAVREHKPQHLVVDLRQNGGGDLTRARDFAESLPSLVPGHVFVLTGPATFSAAISFAGYLKQAAPERVRLVGAPVGDRLEFFAEGRTVRLAHSGEVLLYATERHDYVEGCRRHTDCHAPVVQRPIAVASLAPDLPAPWTLEAYRRGEDPALTAVENALAGR